MSALGALPATAGDVDMEASGVEPIAPPRSSATVPPTPPALAATPSWSSELEGRDATIERFGDLLRHVRNSVRALEESIHLAIDRPNPATYLDDTVHVVNMLTTIVREFHIELLADSNLNNSEPGMAALQILDLFFHPNPALDDELDREEREPDRQRPRQSETLSGSIDIQAAIAKGVEDGIRMANTAITTRLSAIEAQLARNRPPPPPPPPKPFGPQNPPPPPPPPAGRQRTDGPTNAATAQPTAPPPGAPTMAQVAAKSREKSYVLLITPAQHATIEEGGTMPQWYAKIHTRLRKTPAWAKVSFLGLRFAGPSKVMAVFSNESPDALIRECLRPIRHLLGVVPRASSPAPEPRGQATVPQDFRPLAPVTKLFIPSCPLCHPDTGAMLTEEEILAELRRNSMFSTVHFNGLPGFIIPSEQREQLGKSSIIVSVEDTHRDFCARNLLGRDNRGDAAGFVWFYGSRMTVKRSKDRPVFRQCMRCWRLTHLESHCKKRTPVCRFCGKTDHTADMHRHACLLCNHENRPHEQPCDATHFFCVVCGTNGHSAADTTCPARKDYRIPISRSNPSS